MIFHDGITQNRPQETQGIKGFTIIVQIPKLIQHEKDEVWAFESLGKACLFVTQRKLVEREWMMERLDQVKGEDEIVLYKNGKITGYIIKLNVF